MGAARPFLVSVGLLEAEPKRDLATDGLFPKCFPKGCGGNWASLPGTLPEAVRPASGSSHAGWGGGGPPTCPPTPVPYRWRAAPGNLSFPLLVLGKAQAQKEKAQGLRWEARVGQPQLESPGEPGATLWALTPSALGPDALGML